MNNHLQGCGQNDYCQNDSQDQKQAASLVPRVPLVLSRSPELLISTLCVISRASDVVGDDIQRLALLVYHVGDISEELVEFADGLLDVADFGFTFDNERFLEVDFGLIGQAELFLFLQLLLLSWSL